VATTTKQHDETPRRPHRGVAALPASPMGAIQRRQGDRGGDGDAAAIRRLRSLDEAVLTFPEWCALNTLSERTGRRILASGDGPPVTELSSYRIGITVGDNRRWQASRKRV
jgi:hypothetical protein